jgi:spermidine/putrescine transport system substrate-binding protein
MTHHRGGMSRRRFLRGVGAGAGLGAVALGAGLSACSTPGLGTVPLPPATGGRSPAQAIVRFGNWLQYVDTSPAGRHPTLDEFTRQTGIALAYSEPIRTDEQFFGRIGIALAMGRDPGYDLVVFADWMAAQLIAMGWVQPLSAGMLPNAAHLLPQFRDWPVPDIRRYSLAWQGGFTGIGYNAQATRRPVTSMTDLLTAPDLRGRVSLVADMRDVMGLILLDMGSDPSDFSTAEFDAALAMLSRSVTAGQIRIVTDYYLPELTKGTVAAGVAWAGDILFGREENPHLQFAWPKGGGMLWTDNMVIPAYARHKANAERLMNFYYRPEVAAQLTAYERYICPVLGTQAAMQGVDPALAGEKYIFPSPAMLKSGHHFKILPPAQRARYAASFQTAVGL